MKKQRKLYAFFCAFAVIALCIPSVQAAAIPEIGFYDTGLGLGPGNVSSSSGSEEPAQSQQEQQSSTPEVSQQTQSSSSSSDASSSGLTPEQLAQRVNCYYEYEGNGYSTVEERNDAVRAILRERITEEYLESHDGEYPSEEYLAAEVEQQLQATFPMEFPATPESAAS